MKHILLIADNEDSGAALRALLEGHGYAIQVARRGAQGLERDHQAVPDLVMAELPGKGGQLRGLEAEVLRLEQENRELAARETILRDGAERLRLAVQASNVGL